MLLWLLHHCLPLIDVIILKDNPNFQIITVSYFDDTILDSHAPRIL